MIMVGLKIDLRMDDYTIERLARKNMMPVTRQEAEAVARKIHVECYMECSARTQQGVRELFEKVMLVTTTKPKRSSRFGKITWPKMFKSEFHSDSLTISPASLQKHIGDLYIIIIMFSLHLYNIR